MKFDIIVCKKEPEIKSARWLCVFLLKTRQTFEDPNKFSDENLKGQGQKLRGQAKRQ